MYIKQPRYFFPGLDIYRVCCLGQKNSKRPNTVTPKPFVGVMRSQVSRWYNFSFTGNEWAYSFGHDFLCESGGGGWS